MRTREVIVVWGEAGTEAQERAFRTIKAAVAFAEDIAEAFGLPTRFDALRCRQYVAVGFENTVHHVKVYKVRG